MYLGHLRTLGALGAELTLQPHTNGLGANPLPLAAASRRLRGRPGRPRAVTDQSRQDEPSQRNHWFEASAQDSQSGRPTPLTERRLLDVPSLGAYLGGLSDDTVRELERGVLASARVRIPGRGGKTLRNVLFDRLVVDRLIAGWVAPS